MPVFFHLSPWETQTLRNGNIWKFLCKENFSDHEKSLKIACSWKYLLSGKAVFYWKTSGTIFFSALGNRVTPEPELLFYTVLFLFVLPPSPKRPLTLSATNKGRCHGCRGSAPRLSPHRGLTASFKHRRDQCDFMVLWSRGGNPIYFWLQTAGDKSRALKFRTHGLSSRLSSRHCPDLLCRQQWVTQPLCPSTERVSCTRYPPTPMPFLSPALSHKDPRDPQLKCHSAMTTLLGYRWMPLLLCH